MIHRAMLLPLSFLGLEKPREQRHPLVEVWGDDLTQLILAEENGPNKRSPLVFPGRPFSPQVPLRTYHLCHLAELSGPSGRPNEIVYLQFIMTQLLC